jgi:hypothetical protein
MDKVRKLQDDLKSGKITKDVYLAELQKLLDAEDIDQSQFDGAKHYEPPKKDEDGDTGEKTFTQAELDAIIEKRLKREKEKQVETEAKLKRLAELEADEEKRRKEAMSEAERLKAEKDEADRKAVEAAENAKKAQETANQRITNTEIRSIARSLNANNADDVLAFIDKSTVTIDDEGNVKGADEAVKALKESKPYLFKQPVGADAAGGSNRGSGGGGSELAALEKELADAKKEAAKDRRKSGAVTRIAQKIAELKSKK